MTWRRLPAARSHRRRRSSPSSPSSRTAGRRRRGPAPTVASRASFWGLRHHERDHSPSYSLGSSCLRSRSPSKPETTRARPSHLRWFLRSLVGIIVLGAFLAFFLDAPPVASPSLSERGASEDAAGHPRRHHLPSGYHPQFRWEEVVVVAALMILVASMSPDQAKEKALRVSAGPRRKPSPPRSTSRSTTCAPTPTCAARSSPRTRAWRRRSPRPACRAARPRRRSSTSSARCSPSTRARPPSAGSPTSSNGLGSATMSRSRR